MRTLKFAFMGAAVGSSLPWIVAGVKVVVLLLRGEFYLWHLPTMTAFLFTLLCAPVGAFLGAAVALDTRPAK